MSSITSNVLNKMKQASGGLDRVNALHYKNAPPYRYLLKVNELCNSVSSYAPDVSIMINLLSERLYFGSGLSATDPRPTTDLCDFALKSYNELLDSEPVKTKISNFGSKNDYINIVSSLVVTLLYKDTSESGKTDFYVESPLYKALITYLGNALKEKEELSYNIKEDLVRIKWYIIFMIIVVKLVMLHRCLTLHTNLNRDLDIIVVKFLELATWASDQRFFSPKL